MQSVYVYMENFLFLIKKNVNSFYPVRLLFKYLVVFIIVSLNVDNAFSQADFTMTANSGCTDFRVGMELVNFVSDSTVWDFGDGTKAKGNAVFKNYTVQGVFTITMRAYKNGVPATVTKQVTVFKSPVADFTFNKLEGCPPLDVKFTDKSTLGSAPIIKRTWSFSNGVVLEGNQVSPSQIFNAPGFKNISLIVEDQNGCRSNVIYNNAVNVFPRPTVDFNIENSSSCELPVTAIFTNKSGDLANNSFSWNFGDGGTSTVTSPTHSFTKEGTFNITLTATDARGCSNSVTKSNMIVDENFSVDIDFSDTIGCDTLNTIYRPKISSLYKSATWTFDPRLRVDTVNRTIFSDVEGVYTVRLEATSQFGCTISIVRNLYVSKTPVAGFQASPLRACKIPAQINFNNQSSGNNNTYLWTFGDATNSTVADPIKVYNKQGTFSVGLTATNQYGCSSREVKYNYVILQSPQVEIVVDNVQGCVPVVSKFNVQVNNGFTVSNILWNFGNGSTFNGINPPAQTYNSSGKYNVTAIVSFAEGCDNIVLQKEINIGTPITFNATISSTNLCPSELLNGNITAVPNATYKWTVEGSVYDTRTFSHKFSKTGVFNVIAEVNVNGCVSSKTVGTVTVKPTAASFTFTKPCNTNKVIFTNPNHQGVETTWNFGDGTVVVNNNRIVEHTYSTVKEYTVKVSVYNAATGCRDEISKVVGLTPSIFDGFKVDPVQGCAPLNVSFSAPAAPASYYWFYQGEQYNGRSFDIQEDSVGSFNIKLLAVVDGCRDTLELKDVIKVFKPSAGFKFNPLGGCSPITVTFDDTSSSSFSQIQSYDWNVGGLFTKTNVKNFTETFNLTAILPVQLIVTDNYGCKDSVVHDLVIARPIADFEVPSKSFCTGNAFKPVNLSTGVGLQYFWDFGDGTPIDTNRNPEHFYSKEGVYDISLRIVDANNCENTYVMEKAVTIQDIDYDFTAYPTVKHCPELLTDFTIIPQDIIYKSTVWDFGNGSVLDDTLRNPQFLYLNAGVFDVTLTLEDYRGCKEIIKKEKLIDITGPSGEFNVTMNGNCAPVEVKIVADIKSSVANFWDYGDGNGKYDTDAQSETKHTYDLPGVYKPSVTIDDGLGCIVTVEGPEVKVGGVEAKIIKNKDIVCTGELLEMSDVSIVQEHAPLKSRTWSLSDGFTSSDSTISRTLTTNDSTFVFAQLTIVDSLGCSDVAQDTFKVFFEAPLEVLDSLVICKGDTIQLGAYRVYDFEWQNSNSLSALDIPNPLAFPLKSTTYLVRGYVSSTCFKDKSVFVEVRDAFEGEAGQDAIICIGQSADLWVEHDIINSGKFSYSWTLDGVEVDTNQTLQVQPEETSTYIVRVKNGACKDFVAPVNIEVRTYPDVTVSDDVKILNGEEVKLEANSEPGVSFSWDPLPATGCKNCPFAFVRPTQTTVYTVTVNKDGCITTEEITVDVVNDCDENTIEIPNIFTPNNDGLNDVFTLSRNTLMNLSKMSIYSRTGELIYQSSNIFEPWDGTFNGEFVNSGVYIYYIDAVCKNGQPLLLKGNITLLR